MVGGVAREKEVRGGVGTGHRGSGKPCCACARAAGRLTAGGSADGELSTSRRAGPHRPAQTASARCADHPPDPRGRLRTSVPGARAAGLLEVERSAGRARGRRRPVTARAWSRGRWSPPPPALFSFWSGQPRRLRERSAETEGERGKEGRRTQGVGAGESFCATGKTR